MTQLPHAYFIGLICSVTIITTFATISPSWAEDLQCTIKLEACGTLEEKLSPLSKIKEGVCLKTDVASFGSQPKGLYYSAVIWVGVAVSGDTLIFGKGEAGTGIALECSWNIDRPKPEQQISSLKKSIPQLLSNPQFQKQFPGIKKLDTTRLTIVSDADMKCAKAIAQFAKKQ